MHPFEWIACQLPVALVEALDHPRQEIDYCGFGIDAIVIWRLCRSPMPLIDNGDVPNSSSRHRAMGSSLRPARSDYMTGRSFEQLDAEQRVKFPNTV